ncbi:MAG: TIGR01777 family oxidoreductase [Planctomycetota bacterium]
MKILMTGATGFIGSRLLRRLEGGGHSVLVVSRRPGAAVDWSDASLERGVRDTDAVIHLAGENIFDRRWNPRQKQILVSSRVETTKKLAALVAARKPACFLSSSAIGFYGTSETATFDERSPHGSDFMADLCTQWEDATEAAVEAGVRTCRVRTGIALGKGGGALSKMLPFFRLFIGGPLGSGRQWMSWIHVDDLCALYQFLLENPRATGAYNGTAPNPVTNQELSRALGRVLHRPSLLPVPPPMLRLTLGEVAEVLVAGQRVLPRRVEEAGFRFGHPEVEEALRDALGRR